MGDYNEKIAIMLDLIAFSIVDGKLHEKEYMFLSMLAEEFNIEEKDFKNLFHQEDYPAVLKSDFERVKQFYRLALLMFSDGVIHEKEKIKIQEIGMYFGFSPHAVRKVLRAMQKSPTKTISPEFLMEIFSEQMN